MVDFTRGLFSTFTRPDATPADFSVFDARRAGATANLANAQTNANRLDFDRQREATAQPLRQREQQRREFATASDAQAKQADKIIKGQEFISNRFGNIRTEDDLSRVNEQALKLGIFAPNQLPTSLEQARDLFETSELFKLQFEANKRLELIEVQQKSKLELLQERAKIKGKLEDDKLKRSKELIAERDRLGFGRFLLEEPIRARNRQPQTVINLPGAVSRQDGGPVAAGQPALVGEDGPELIVPDRDINVIPNEQTEQLTQQDPNLVETQGEEQLVGSQGNDTKLTEFNRLIDDAIRANEQAPTQIAGGQAKPLSADAAKALARAKTSLQALDILEQIVSMNEDGISQEDLLVSTPIQNQLVRGVVNVNRTQKQQDIAQTRRFLVDTIARVQSGAALNEKEIANFKAFLPEFGDTKETQLRKIATMRMLFGITVDRMEGRLSKTESIFDKDGNISSRIQRRETFISNFIELNGDQGATRKDAMNFIKEKGKKFE